MTALVITSIFNSGNKRYSQNYRGGGVTIVMGTALQSYHSFPKCPPSKSDQIYAKALDNPPYVQPFHSNKCPYTSKNEMYTCLMGFKKALSYNNNKHAIQMWNAATSCVKQRCVLEPGLQREPHRPEYEYVNVKVWRRQSLCYSGRHTGAALTLCWWPCPVLPLRRRSTSEPTRPLQIKSDMGTDLNLKKYQEFDISKCTTKKIGGPSSNQDFTVVMGRSIIQPGLYSSEGPSSNQDFTVVKVHHPTRTLQ